MKTKSKIEEMKHSNQLKLVVSKIIKLRKGYPKIGVTRQFDVGIHNYNLAISDVLEIIRKVAVPPIAKAKGIPAK